MLFAPKLFPAAPEKGCGSVTQARCIRRYSSIRRACRTISLPRSNCLAHYSPKPCQNSSYRCYGGCCGTLFLSFALLAAAPLQAQAREERSVPTLPLPHVTRTAAVHLQAASSLLPLPRSRPAPTTGPAPPCCTEESAGSDKRLIQLARGCSRKWRA